MSQIQALQQNIKELVYQHRATILRIFFIAGLMMFIAIFAPKIAQGNQTPILVIVLILGIFSSLVLLKYRYIGLIGLIPACLVIPFGLGTGSQTSLNAGILLLAWLIGIWIFDMIARERRFSIVSSKTYVPLFFFAIICFLSFGMGQLPWFSFSQPAPIRSQIGALAIFLLAFGAFLLVGNWIRHQKTMEWMVWIFLIIGSFYILSRTIPGLNFLVNRIFPTGSTGSMFWTWLISIAFSQVLINRKMSPIGRFLIGVLLIGTLYVALVKEQGWTSGWLPAIASMGFIFWFNQPKYRLVIILCAIIAAAFFIQNIIGVVMIGDNSYSLETRLAAWRIMFEIIKINPILGLGPANYYFYTPLFPIMGYSVSFNSHNNYVDIVAQTGLLGLACFIWFAWEVGKLGWNLKGKVSDGFQKAYVYGALGGLVGTIVAGMLGDWFLPYVYNVGFDGFRSGLLAWLFLGGLVAVDQLIKNDNQISSRGAA